MTPVKQKSQKEKSSRKGYVGTNASVHYCGNCLYSVCYYCYTNQLAGSPRARRTRGQHSRYDSSPQKRQKQQCPGKDGHHDIGELAMEWSSKVYYDAVFPTDDKGNFDSSLRDPMKYSEVAVVCGHCKQPWTRKLETNSVAPLEMRPV